MTDSPAKTARDHASGSRQKPRMPRWVKAFAIVGIVLAVLVVLMLAGVLGEGHGPGRHRGGARHKTATGIGGPAEGSAARRTVDVRTTDALRFEPSTIAVSAGEVVTFAVTNGGKVVHEFTMGNSAMQQEHAAMMRHVPAGMGHDTPNSIRLEPGQTKRLTWQFGDAGTLEYACHVQGHYQAGMRGRVVIT